MILLLKILSCLSKKFERQVFEKNELFDSINKETGGYFANFLIEKIKLPYENIELKMTFQLKQGNKSSRHQVRFIFKTDHQKFLRIIGV